AAAREHRWIGGRGTNREQAALQLFRLRGDCFWHHRRKVSIMSHERVPSFSVFKLFEGFSLSLAYLASPLAYLFGVGEQTDLSQMCLTSRRPCGCNSGVGWIGCNPIAGLPATPRRKCCIFCWLWSG